MTRLTPELVAPWLPRRALDVHKYDAGAVLVLAGSERYQGAAELVCRAALRAGAGLVTLAAPERYPGGWPEVVLEPLDWLGDPLEHIDRQSDPLERLAAVRPVDARVIGPGLDERAAPLLPRLVALSDAPTVLDATALVNSGEWRAALRNHGRCVLTPHAGEAARLLGVGSSAVRADPFGTARELAAMTGAVAVVKGALTVVSAPDGRVAYCDRGHPGMATGGSGDVLAGCMAALMCGLDDVFEAAGLAVFACGVAGERAAARHGNGMVPSDTVDELGATLGSLAD